LDYLLINRWQQARPWQQLRNSIAGATSLALAIGPEGAFSASDIETLHNHGFQALQFGRRTLRTETAAPVQLVAIQAVL